jgi:tRNA pseudouridine65 synthase
MEAITVLARSRAWAVVAKPSGLPIHRSEFVRSGPTLVAEAGRLLDAWVDPVHRLDQPVSGCLLLSLDRTVTPKLQEALSRGQKQYLAMVRGAIPSRDPHTEERPLIIEGVEKTAKTVFRPLGSSTDPRCSLVLANPETGRYHQLRRHLRGLDHPILGDSTHGDTRENKRWRDQHGLLRLALHCAQLDLQLDDEVISAQAPLPADLRELFQRMPWWAEACERYPALTLP